jgi:hypothetical protein
MFVPFFLFISGATLVLAEGTRTWEQSKFDDLVKGTPKGVALLSTGGLELAPSFKQLYTTPSTFIWSIAADDSGNVYAAAGSPARVYWIKPNGEATPIFEPQELQVQALVVDKSGVIFAATSPDGKVYKIERPNIAVPNRKQRAKAEDKAEGAAKNANDAAWTSTIYFDPGTKYIWDLALAPDGSLYVATGDHGEIHRVARDGSHSVFFKSDEAHIRVLALEPNGDLIAGSDGSGLVYRVSPSGEAFVLYSAPKKEITALAIDDAGNIYAAAAGEKHASNGPSSAPGTATLQPVPSAATGPVQGSTITLGVPGPGSAPLIPAFPAPGTGASGGSEVYRIAPDGSPLRIWTSQTDLVYALSFDEHGNLLAGTGNRGHIFAVTGQDEFIDLVKAGASQVTAFAKAPGGGLYAATSNLGKLFVIGSSPDAEGTYESDVFDAHNFSRWGRAEFRGMGNVQLMARSGNVDNPDRNWSPWTPVDLTKEAALAIPSARFVQWKAVLRASNPAPHVSSVLLNYLPKNVAPQIDDVSVQLAVRYQPAPKPAAENVSVGSTQGGQHFEAPVPSTHDRDSIGIKWAAHDDNEDELLYSVYYRGDHESRWLLLKDKLTDKFYSFDAGLLPDGGYTIKVIASDAPSHSPGDALSTEKESDRFEVDTTPPQIQNLAAAVEKDGIHVTFRALDNFSPVKRAEYSVDAGEWQFIEPVDQISDAKSENYDFQIALGGMSSNDSDTRRGKQGKRMTAVSASQSGNSAIEHVIVIRAYDRFDNVGTAKTLIRR